MQKEYPGVELDIGQKSEKEMKVLHDRALDEAILSSIGEGLVVTNVKGEVTFVNQAFCKITGWEAGEVLGKSLGEVLPAQDLDGKTILFSEEILSKILKGEKIKVEASNPIYNLKKDNSKFPASTIMTPVIFKNEIIGAVKIFRDITKERNIDLVKSEFVSLASHQLRTPLSSINWYTEMLLAGDAGELKEEQKKYLEEVYQASKRMVVLVKSLLDVSRMDLGTFVINAEEVDVQSLVQSVVDEQKQSINKNAINFSVKYGRDLPHLHIDPKHLRMIVQNLLSNSLKYTPANGNIDISVALDNQKKYLILIVTDTGYGIPKSEQEKVFSKLFRAKNVQEKDTEGTGLGLYIVKTLVENSGGKVRFESVENKGTTFFVVLPL